MAPHPLLLLVLLLLLSPATTLSSNTTTTLSSNTTTTTTFSTHHHHQRQQQHHLTTLRYLCTTTPHPSACLATLKLSLPISLSPPSLLSSAFLSLNAAISSLSSSPLLLQPPSRLSITKQRRGSLQDCADLHRISLSSLRLSAASLHSPSPSSSNLSSSDLNAHLSAALTNRRTCLDGLRGSSGRDLPSLLRSISDAYDHVGNALSLVSRSSNSRGLRGRRRLLGTFPAWLSRKDRRILESDDDGDDGLTLTVAKDGSGDFTTIGDAVANAPSNNHDERTFIWIRAGVYEENVDIPADKVNIVMFGEGRDVTVIRGRRSAAEGWTSFRSATLGVAGRGFLARDLTIENVAGAVAGQAIALRVNADLSALYRCTISGFQDTLYAHSFRQFYRECDISGTVDFVFGNAAAVLQSCNLIARLPIRGQSNVVTAQGRDDPNEDTGISIDRCSIVAADDLADGSGRVRTYLGRPWKPYSRTVVMKSFVGGLVDAAGWLNWEGDRGLDTLYYGEYDNDGPGSDPSNRVDWPGYHLMNYDEAVQFSVSEFIEGDQWLGDTSFPYDDGV